VGQVDGAGEVFEDEGFEAEAGGGEGGEADAEVVSDAGEEEAGEAAFAKIAGEAGGGDAIVFGEGGVAVDVLAEALAEDELGVRDGEVGMEVGAAGTLNAVVGPEGLGAVGGLDGVGKWVKAVGAGEGDVVRGMPVLGEDDLVEAGGEGVDAGEEGVAVRDGQGAAGEKVQLHVDDEEGVGGSELHRNKRTILCKGSEAREAEGLECASERVCGVGETKG